MDTRIAVVLVILSALAACGGKAEVGDATANPASAASAAPKPLQQVVPAIIPPDEVADPTEPPSYEVAIASAAATRNHALERCTHQPEAVRTQCEQEANAAFADAEAGLQNLRGNQE
jgi:hypothetical protein